jgi:competence protein ComGC
VITAILVVSVLVFLGVVRVLVRKEAIDRKNEATFARIVAFLKSADEREERMWQVLELVKSYYESGRVQHKEASVAKEEIGAKVDTATGVVVQKIDEMPQKVAEVLDKKADSGVQRRPTGGT